MIRRERTFRCYTMVLLNLWFAQHVLGTIMAIIRSLRLYRCSQHVARNVGYGRSMVWCEAVGYASGLRDVARNHCVASSYLHRSDSVFGYEVVTLWQSNFKQDFLLFFLVSSKRQDHPTAMGVHYCARSTATWRNGARLRIIICELQLVISDRAPCISSSLNVLRPEDPCIHFCNGYFEVWCFVKNNRRTSLIGGVFISYDR
jgi:hypothetical protein